MEHFNNKKEKINSENQDDNENLSILEFNKDYIKNKEQRAVRLMFKEVGIESFSRVTIINTDNGISKDGIIDKIPQVGENLFLGKQGEYIKYGKIIEIGLKDGSIEFKEESGDVYQIEKKT